MATSKKNAKKAAKKPAKKAAVNKALGKPSAKEAALAKKLSADPFAYKEIAAASKKAKGSSLSMAAAPAAAAGHTLAWSSQTPIIADIVFTALAGQTSIDVGLMAANAASQKVVRTIGAPGQSGQMNINHFDAILKAGTRKSITAVFQNNSPGAKTFDLVFTFGGGNRQSFTYTLQSLQLLRDVIRVTGV